MKVVTELVFALLGLRAAEMTALPSNIIQEAKTIASKVSQQLLVWFIKIRFGLFVLYTFYLHSILSGAFAACATLCATVKQVLIKENNIRRSAVANIFMPQKILFFLSDKCWKKETRPKVCFIIPLGQTSQ